MFIAPFRKLVYELLRNETRVPVFSYLPDDVAHLPCHVVGRPSIRENPTPAVMIESLDVTLLGRRISDEDSQAELDALADELFTVLGGTRSVKRNGSHLRCTTLFPGTVFVAGQEMPAYIATVAIDILSC